MPVDYLVSDILEEEIIEKSIPENVTLWLEKELSKTTTAVLNDFESPLFFTKKNAKVVGYIKGYDKKKNASTVMFYYTNQLTRESKPRVLKIHEDGRFELELPLEFPLSNRLIIQRKVIPFYIEPGQTLSVILDSENLNKRSGFDSKKHISYQGGLKEINENLNYFKLNFDYKNISQKKANMAPLKFKEEQLLLKEERVQKIEAYENSGEIDRKTSILLKDEIILHASYNIMDYFSGRKFKNLNSLSEEKHAIETPKGYYNFIRELPLGKQSFLVNNRFMAFINRLEYLPPIQDVKKGDDNVSKTFQKLNNLFDFLKGKGEVFSIEEKMLMEEWRSNGSRISEELKKKLEVLYENHKTSFEEFYKVNLDGGWGRQQLRIWRKKDSVVKTLGFKNDLMYEVIKLRTLKYIPKTVEEEEVKSYWDELSKSIKSPYLRKTGNELLKERFSKPDKLTLPTNDRGTRIFKKIVKPYKGKIVVVQFWNPHSFYREKSLKRYLEKKNMFDKHENVELIYITDKGRTSRKAYEELKEKCEFKNSRGISNDNFNYMRQLFQKNTSLWFVLVGKNGQLLDNDFPFRNIEYEFKKRFNISPKN
jgi:hypothetical protein